MKTYVQAAEEMLLKFPTDTPNVHIYGRNKDCPTTIIKVGESSQPIHELRINVKKRADGKCFEVREYITEIGLLFEHVIVNHFEALDKTISYAYEVAGDFNTLYKKYKEM